jgi:hypothetical protein
MDEERNRENKATRLIGVPERYSDPVYRRWLLERWMAGGVRGARCAR